MIDYVQAPPAPHVYNGIVAAQEKGSLRVKLQCPQVLGAAISAWASPLGYMAIQPSVGTQVLVQFIAGDTRYPLYSVPVAAPPPTPVSMAFQTSNIASTQNVTLTDGSYHEFTNTQWPYITINVPPSMTFQAAMTLYGAVDTSGYGIHTGYNIYSSTGTLLFTGDDYVSARTTNVTGTEGYAHNTSPVTASSGWGSTITFRPTYHISTGGTSVTGHVYLARLTVYPLMHYDYTGTVH